MSAKVNPNLMQELKQYGLNDANKCFHCGNCTGVCPLSTPDNPFPRKLVRYAQLGLEDKLAKAPEPWLCYYCGECSDMCPRGADPGETMMAMRRYLTAKYDWTGFARRFYTSEVFEVSAISIAAALIGLAFILFANWDASTTEVQLTQFAPNWVIKILDDLMGITLSILLLSNVWRCVKTVMGQNLTKIPASVYLKQAKELIVNFFTQKEFSKCEDRKQWIVHLLLMTGYTSVFLMVVVGINYFQRDHVIDPNSPVLTTLMFIVGWYATCAILYGAGYALIGRIRKSKAPYKNSHGTDWMFLILLILTTLTGIMIQIFIALGAPMAVYIIYMIHMMVAVPMLVLEVPFAKWAHLAYRPVVLFLLKVKAAHEAAGGELAKD